MFLCFTNASMVFSFSGLRSNRCKLRLLLVKIAMAIWFQVSGVKCQVSGVRCQVSGFSKHVQSELFIDLKILNVHIIAVGPLFSHLTNP